MSPEGLFSWFIQQSTFADVFRQDLHDLLIAVSPFNIRYGIFRFKLEKTVKRSALRDGFRGVTDDSTISRC